MSDIPIERPYTPEYVESHLREAGFWQAARRVWQVLRVLLVGWFYRTVDRWRWTYRRGGTEAEIEARQRRRAEWLRDRLIWLGPTFVKLGQSLAARPDLLPMTYLQVLSTLHDQIPTFPNETAYAFIEEELRWKPETLFAQFDPEPFAAASLGQVYHAVTYEGDEVAVKVQRPDLLHIISLDLALLRRLAAFAERHPRLGRGQPWVDLVDEFGTKLFEELDYVHEAHLTERFRANFEGLEGVYAPRVYWEFSSRRVLTTEYIKGIKVTDKARLEEAGIDILTLLAYGTRANLTQLFEHGLFHADPHPGNLLVRPEDGVLVFLDFGMMSIVGEDKKRRMIEIFIDVINRRPENLKDNLIALGFLQPDARWDEILPLALELFASVFGSEEKQARFQDVTAAFSPLLYEYEFRIPVDFAYIVRSIMILEGIALQLDPEFDIWAVSAPYAARMMLTFPDPGVRRRLMAELLTPDGGVDWQRLDDLAALASRDDGFRLQTEGLLEPALDLILSPEGAELRRALVAEMLRHPEAVGERADDLAPLLTSDPTLSGRDILTKLIAFLLSPEGEETRAQLLAGLRRDAGGRSGLDLARLLDLAGQAAKLHPEFRPGTVVGVVGGYLLSPQGKAARQQLLTAGARWAAGSLAGVLERLARPPQSTACPSPPSTKALPVRAMNTSSNVGS